MKDEEIKRVVREHYGQRARQATSCCSGPTNTQIGQTTSCCSGDTRTSNHIEKIYSADELNGFPESVTNAAAGCGNPTALAELKPGNVVLDLGSGGGIDCFLAAQKVGADGKVIGVDMTPDMLQLARENADKMQLANVEFRLGEIEHLPVADSSVDVVISNCVINLSPNKAQVFKETYRVLKPGGRIMVSDIVLLGKLPESVKNDPTAWASCIAGASLKEEYLAAIAAAGFRDVKIVSEATSSRPGELSGVLSSVKVSAVKLN